ncbi:MAG: hypothetical protein IJU39_02735 [Clostridia bacterium]|nr:hypothetical protein [Clostridia bacterium]
MENKIRIAVKSDIFRLTEIYEKNGLSPRKTVCKKSLNELEAFLNGKNNFILVCERGGRISACCEVSVVPSLCFSSCPTVFVSGMCCESEKSFNCLCLLIAKIREVAFRRNCGKIIFLNETCSGFLNSVYMSSGLRRDSCYSI